LQKGADGILVAGCYPGECHYSTGNLYVRRQLTLLRSLLEYLGLEKGRLHFIWISSAQGDKFARVVREITEEVKKLGPSKKLVKKF